MDAATTSYAGKFTKIAVLETSAVMLLLIAAVWVPSLVKPAWDNSGWQSSGDPAPGVSEPVAPVAEPEPVEPPTCIEFVAAGNDPITHQLPGYLSDTVVIEDEDGTTATLDYDLQLRVSEHFRELERCAPEGEKFVVVRFHEDIEQKRLTKFKYVYDSELDDIASEFTLTAGNKQYEPSSVIFDEAGTAVVFIVDADDDTFSLTATLVYSGTLPDDIEKPRNEDEALWESISGEMESSFEVQWDDFSATVPVSTCIHPSSWC